MFSSRLKQLRESKKLSQRDLAKILKLSPSTVAMYEVNQRSPDKETLSVIADFFNVSVDYLLGRDNNVPPPNQKPKKLYDVIARAEDLPEENLDQVVDALEALIKHHEEKMKNKRKTK